MNKVAQELVMIAKSLVAKEEEIASVTFDYKNGDYYNVKLMLNNNELYAEFDYEKLYRNGVSKGITSVAKIGLLLDVTANDIISLCQRKSRPAGFGRLDFTKWDETNGGEAPLSKILQIARSKLEVSGGDEYTQLVLKYEKSSNTERVSILEKLVSTPAPKSTDVDNLRNAAKVFLDQISKHQGFVRGYNQPYNRLLAAIRLGNRIYQGLKQKVSVDDNENARHFGVLMYDLDKDIVDEKYHKRYGWVSAAEHMDFIEDLYKVEAIVAEFPETRSVIQAFHEYSKTLKEIAPVRDELEKDKQEFYKVKDVLLRSLTRR